MHEFALYVPNIAHTFVDEAIEDAGIVHRIARVLRLHEGDQCILFDARQHCTLRITQITKKQVLCTLIGDMQLHSAPYPYIKAWLPLLKREALEQAVYNLTEVGCNEIHLVTTDNMQASWRGARQMERLERIVIAASEQAKQFALPFIHAPQSLGDLLVAHEREMNERLMVADITGQTLFSYAQSMKQSSAWLDQAYVVLIGPEAALSPAELDTLRAGRARFVRLTPTILRAQQAITLAVGSLRSLLEIDQV